MMRFNTEFKVSHVSGSCPDTPKGSRGKLTLHQPREDQNSTSTLPFNDFVLILDSIQKRQLDDPRYGRPNIKGARVPREPMTGSTYPCHRLKAGNPQAIWGGAKNA